MAEAVLRVTAICAFQMYIDEMDVHVHNSSTRKTDMDRNNTQPDLGTILVQKQKRTRKTFLRTDLEIVQLMVPDQVVHGKLCGHCFLLRMHIRLTYGSRNSYANRAGNTDLLHSSAPMLTHLFMFSRQRTIAANAFSVPPLPSFAC